MIKRIKAGQIYFHKDIKMKYRGFKPNYTSESLLKYAIEHNKSLLDYEPDENDIKISRDRIIERYKKKPDYLK